jgi:alkanesulfonate monooxygenase SsuD/methylene tetrahydromethanopterin reductase-like flavin-dependent oxidoreductase (luciferase family)
VTIDQIDPTPRRAHVFTPMETRLQVLIEAAVTAEQLGYDAVVVPEGWGLDAGIALAAIASRTEHIRLVAGVLSIWGRSAGTLAMTAAALDDLSDGRFVLGLGTSTRALAECLHDERFVRPAARLGRTVDEVRRLLAGDRAVTHASGCGRGLRLGRAARPDVPIWVAGLGPRSVAVAIDGADAWFPVMIPRDRVRQRWAGVRPDRAAGRSVELVTGPHVVADRDAARARAAAQQIAAWYLVGMGPLYGDAVAAYGYADEVAAVRRVNPRPRWGELAWPDAADPLLDQLTVHGHHRAVSDGLREWDELSDVVAVCIGPGPAEQVMATIEAAAP